MASATVDLLGLNIGLRPYLNYFKDWAPFDEVIFILDCCRDRDYNSDTAGPSVHKKKKKEKEAPEKHRRVVDFVVMATAYGDEAFAPVEKPTKERRGNL